MNTINYFISVGEPWDFTSPDGQNIIKGSILIKLSPTCIVFKANYTVELQGVEGDILVLFPRHYGSDFDDFNKGKNFVTVNGCLLLTNLENNPNEQTLKEKSKFVIIGSLRES